MGVGPKYFRYKLPHSRRGVGGLQEGPENPALPKKGTTEKKFPNIATWPHPGSFIYNIYIHICRGAKKT